MTKVKKNSILIMIAALLTVKNANASECFGGSKFPKMLAPRADNANSRYQAITASEELNAIFIGGYTESADLYTYDSYYGDPLGVIARIDLDTNLYVFQNVYEA